MNKLFEAWNNGELIHGRDIMYKCHLAVFWITFFFKVKAITKRGEMIFGEKYFSKRRGLRSICLKHITLLKISVALRRA